jgi:ParB family chromosome partitioning protein
MEELQRIPLNKIRTPRIALRPIRRNSVEYIELVQSVKKDGVLQPILVRPTDDTYEIVEIVEGWHRFEASVETGKSDIPCFVRSMTDRDVLIYQLKLQAIRPVVQTFEYARRLKLLMEDGLTLDGLSAQIDKSQKWIRDQIQLNRLCEEARKPVEDGKISMSSALALANLPSEIQTQFVKEAVTLKASDFIPRAKRARRDFDAFLQQEKVEKEKLGTPRLRSLNVLKREAVKPTHAHDVLKATGAKTALEGWEACMAWVFKLDPISVSNKGKKEDKRERLATDEEYRSLNRKMIQKYVNPQRRSKCPTN